MTIEQLKQWYNLQPEDFWQLRRGGKTITIITHNACEKIAEMVNIVIGEPKWLSQGQDGVWAVQVTGWKRLQPEHKIWATGESSPDNCKTDYPVVIAEKRAKDRLTHLSMVYLVSRRWRGWNVPKPISWIYCESWNKPDRKLMSQSMSYDNGVRSCTTPTKSGIYRFNKSRSYRTISVTDTNTTQYGDRG